MPKRYLGNIITNNPTEPTENYANSAASGVWSLAEAERYTRAGVWPNAANLAPVGLFHNTYSSTTSTNNHIAQINILTTGNATDFGDLSQYRYATACGSASSSTRGLFMGGEAAPGFQNTIDYVTIASAGNATYFGALTATSYGSWQLSSSTRGVIGGRLSATTDNRINYVTIASTGNASDFGDMAVIHYNSAGLASTTRGVYAMGPTTTSDVIEYITIASTGNGTDFGDLTNGGRNNGAGASNSTRGLWYGGEPASSPYNVVDYITIASTGNATDFGDASGNAFNTSGLSGSTRAIFARGNNNVTIEYFTIASTGDATDFGDLITGQGHNGAASNSHGGIA